MARRKGGRPRVERLESRRLMSLDVTELPLGTPYGNPYGIVAGADGNLWVGEFHGILESINPITDVIAHHPIPTSQGGSVIYGIAAGPDGNIWFTEHTNQAPSLRVGEFNLTTGVLSQYPILTQAGSIGSIAAGPDGKLWFTEGASDQIGEIDPRTDAIAEFPIPTPNAVPLAITAGPDGNLWFTEDDDHLASISPATHAVVEFQIPVPLNSLPSITTGPDGRLWFTGQSADFGVGPAGYIVSFDPATDDFAVHGDPTSNNSYASGIAVGPDGNLWFTEFGSVGEISPTTGAIAEVPTPTAGSGPFGVVTGPDHHIWFTEASADQVGTFDPRGFAAIGGTVSLDPAADGTGSGGPLRGRTVYLDLKGTGQYDPADPTSVTSDNGGYWFIGLAPGAYTVRLVTYPGDTSSGQGPSRTVTLAAGQIAAPAPFDLVSTGAIYPLFPNPSPFGTAPSDIPTAEVNALYNLLLGRGPSAGDLADGVKELVGGASPSTIASSLLGSGEYNADIAAAAYSNDLSRPASPSEISTVLAAFQAGLTPEQLVEILVTSREFGLIHPGVDGFVAAAYRDILGRPASASEVSGVAALITGGLSRDGVVQSLLRSGEYDVRAVEGLYAVFFDRPAEQGGLTNAVNELQGGASFRDLAAGLAGSLEFLNKAVAAVPGPTTLPIPDRADYAFDGRGMLYITDGPNLDRYDVQTRSFLTPWYLGGRLLGIDLSPDGETLAVADSTKGGFDLVDVATGRPSSVYYNLAGAETGSYAVAWGSDGTLLITGGYNGSGLVPLRRYDPTTGKTTVVDTVGQNTMLTPSADRTTIGLAESNSSLGPVDVYSVAKGRRVAQDSLYWDTFDIAANRDGTQFVVPTIYGAYVLNFSGSTFTQQTILGQYASHGPIDAVYSPTYHYMFTTEYDSGDVLSGVKVYDTDTWKQVGSLETLPFSSLNENDFGVGWLKVSPDGRTLAVSVDGGTRIYDVSAYASVP